MASVWSGLSAAVQPNTYTFRLSRWPAGYRCSAHLLTIEALPEAGRMGAGGHVVCMVPDGEAQTLRVTKECAAPNPRCAEK